MHSPVGSWLARVRRPSGDVEIGLHFTGDGLAFLISGAHGVGTWRPEGDGFVFHLAEAMLGDDGGFSGYIDIRQQGSVTADHLVSSGESLVYGADGALMRTVPVSISAVRRRK
jgi:hypothetical protein